MNIVITLPKMLAQQIYDGSKTIEIRKSWPTKFNLLVDTVYICEKGTTKVSGIFTVDKIEISTYTEEIWHYHARELAIDRRWYDKYTAKKQNYYLWYIKLPLKFYIPYSLKDVFHMDKQPQSYAYTDVNWYLDENWDAAIDVRH